MRAIYFRTAAFTIALVGVSSAVSPTRAQTPLSVYSDQLASGFQDWSWGSRDFANTSPVFSGSRSIQFSGAFWEAISFYHADVNTGPYTSFTFSANGGSTGGQRLQLQAQTGDTAGPTFVLQGRLPTNEWRTYSIPLSSLGISNVVNFNRINIVLRNDGSSAPYFLDELLFDPKPAPDLVRVSVDALRPLHVVDERHFGVNLAMWDPYFDPPHHTTTIGLLEEMGTLVVRMPGGSLSDEYHWGSNTTLSNSWQWATSFGDMVRVATNAGVQAFITVNYGTGTPEEAAAWVRHANVTNNLGYRYWEIGNECYGTWERDTNTLPHHAFTYATRAAQYMAQMRAADSSIRIGVVAAPGEDAYANGYTTHPVFNARTGGTHYGWTPILLTTFKNLGVTPDFLVHHHYPNWTDPSNPGQSPNNDAAILQATGNWAADAADLRQQIIDYFGPGGTNIELVVTENNVDAGAQGRQSTSLVNALYYADSLGELLKTEFRSFVWWDFRNGTDTQGFFGADIYGWRAYGDLGMVNGPSTRHPAFYAAKLMKWFARPGDKVIPAQSDYSGLASHAVRRSNGELTLLVINKSLVTNQNASIAVNGYLPNGTAIVRMYGIPQDEAARTNAPLGDRDIAVASLTGVGTNFGYNFAPMSLTLFTMAPAAPSVTVSGPSANSLALNVDGQVEVPYRIESSTNLLEWDVSATNVFSGSSIIFTNDPSAPAVFWRAVWEP
ncbi:MAG TPA: alpha-L-arabinofuranosidase [Verrucomicrobiae bacterium]|nr:alpha-L-arabinofuranosidase [Verrucomicrobiae bacterium]